MESLLRSQITATVMVCLALLIMPIDAMWCNAMKDHGRDIVLNQ